MSNANEPVKLYRAAEASGIRARGTNKSPFTSIYIRKWQNTKRSSNNMNTAITLFSQVELESLEKCHVDSRDYSRFADQWPMAT